MANIPLISKVSSRRQLRKARLKKNVIQQIPSLNLRRSTAILGWTLTVVVALIRGWNCLDRPAERVLSDLGVYRGAIAGLLNGDTLYEFTKTTGSTFTYPPFASFVLLPTVLLPTQVINIAWVIATLFTFGAIASCVARRISVSPWQRMNLAWGICLLILISQPGFSNLRWGQVSFFIALLILIDVLGSVPARFRGIAIGLAASIKITPLIFIPYLWFSGKRQDAIRALTTFLTCTGIAIILLPGDSGKYWLHRIWKSEGISHPENPENQSINGLLLRMGVEDNRRIALWVISAAIVALLAYWRTARKAGTHDAMTTLVVIGAASLAVSPVSWAHHQIWLLLAATIVLSAYFRYQILWMMTVVFLITFPTAELGMLVKNIDSFPHIFSATVSFLLIEAQLLFAVAIAAIIPFKEQKNYTHKKIKQRFDHHTTKLFNRKFV